MEIVRQEGQRDATVLKVINSDFEQLINQVKEADKGKDVVE